MSMLSILGDPRTYPLRTLWLMVLASGLAYGPVAWAQPADEALRADVQWLLEYADPPEEPEDERELSFGDRLQKRVDEGFGAVNDYLIPVLFFDVARGAFDPTAETLRDDLATASSELDAELAKPREQRSGKRLRELRKSVERLEGWIQTLDQKQQARQQWLPRARRTVAAYRALPETQRDPEVLRRLTEARGNLRGMAGATIHSVPLIVAFLLLGGVFFTLRFGFINLRLFKHSLLVIRGKFDDPDDHGEINHFQALTSALSATVGLGNIAGVAIAISQGGAGAVFWMWVVAFFGMNTKFSSCTLAQMYRRITGEARDHGAADEGHAALPGKSEHVLGGPMVYLHEGMKELFGKTFGSPFGRTLAILFAFFAIMGSLGGGNMFQGNQTFAIVGDVLFVESVPNEAELLAAADAGDAAAEAELAAARADAAEAAKDKRESYAWVGGLIMAVLVGIVIVGGIKRIGEVTSKLVPAMCLFYVGVCLIIVFYNFGKVPELLGDIVGGAFTTKAVAWGGIMGVLVIGVTRGAFSNEAGLGSAAIAHSAARTKEPVREGVVAMVGPFIDTIIVCTMTALAILITEAHHKGSAGGFSNEGVGITASAFSALAGWLPYLLTLAVFIFAYSTMISWSYYGERASEYLFGHYGIWPYRVVFLLFVFIAPMISLNNVITFTDLLILSMAYPNILGMLLLSGKVAHRAKDYVRRLGAGQMKPGVKSAEPDPAAGI